MTALSPRRRVAVGVSELTFIERSLRRSVRNVDALLMAIMLPVLVMFLFTFVFGGSIDPSGNYVNYVVPGIILLCAGFGASSTAVDVAGDMTTGIIDRFRSLPIPATAVLTGHVVASLLRNLVATGVVVVVALAVGFRPTGGPGDWLAAISVVALYILAITYLFAAIGLASSSPEAASGYGFILLFLPYLSSAFVEVSTLPSWLQPIAQYQPVTPTIEAIRSLLMGTSMGNNAVIAVGWCVLILVIAATWGAWLFRRKAGHR
ncbi:ABC transporter permease [Mycetocola zhadangensis]|uniref:Transport permease protein n=1 Tax=Mycetocola zhadangensis TaxID=1164595 RepID=A0A3L7IT94_9MICO|nr:ABC transporter permease [Mycetocola zhadangensis]RLQ81413.1 ABC transporter permease [Mycetocola zhadangensis]GGF01934.1 transport permease protein [Mycetocola zhadangensis]